MAFVVATVFMTGAIIFAHDGGLVKNRDLGLNKTTGSPRSTLLNINNMAHWFRADGWSARDPRTGNAGVVFPRGISTQLAVIFQDGLIWGGLVQDGQTPELRVGGQTYNIGTVEGRIISKGQAEDPNAPDVHIYRIRPDFNTADLSLDAKELGLSEDEVRAQYAKDWAEWPWEKGAPWTGINNQLDGGYLGPDGETIIGAGNGVLDRGEDQNSNGKLDPGEDANGNGVLDGEFPGIAGAQQVVWTVANDLSPGATQGLYGSPPIGLEMQLAAWGYLRQDALGNMIFKQFKLIYKGTSNTPSNAQINQMYLCQWSDPDLGTYTDDFVGVDTTLSLAYVYNSSSIDNIYNSFGFPPPAAGYDFFQGVLVPGQPGQDLNKNGIDDAEDTGIFNLKKTRTGLINLPMTSFGYFAAGASFSDPGPLGSYEGTIEWWNLLRGFLPQSDPNNPEPFPTSTGEVTKFPLNGDPVTGTGDIDGIILPPGDRRMLEVTGPFTMALGDTQEVVVSLIAAIGSDRLSSVQVLKFFDRTAQATFDNLFQVPRAPAAPKVKAIGLDGEIILNWGFDPAAVKETESQDELGFRFEGYNVYQLKTPSPDLSPDNAIKLATFDKINEVTTILSEDFDVNAGVIIQRPVQVGKNTGIKRFFRVTEDAFRDRPLSNDQDFFFAVTAYNVTLDPEQTTKSLESPPIIITVRPQKPKVGVRYHAVFGDTIDVEHVGGSDGSVVVKVVDPTAITGHDYKVVFGKKKIGVDEEGNDIFEDVWHLLDVTTGDTVLKDQTKQITDPSDEEFLTADGLFIQVFGAPKDAKRTPNGSPALIEVAGPNGPLTPDDYDSQGAPFGGNLVWHSLNAAVDGPRWYVSAGGGSGTESRLLRNNNIGNAVPFDLEMRFTEQGSIMWWAFDNGELGPVPFELWNVGVGTFDDPSDDKQLIPISFSGGNTPGVYDFVNTDNFFGATKCSDWTYWYDGDFDAFIADAADGVLDNDPTTVEYLARMIICDAAEFGFPGLEGNPPGVGTVIRVFTTKPNSPADEFMFSTAQFAKTEDNTLKKKDAMELINVFPNPYLGVNRLENSQQNKFVRFNHLPDQATIRIFNLAGTLVKTIEKNDPGQWADWDLKNEKGLPVASGLYLAHIEMPGIGEKTLKLVIIQEQQFLRTF